LGSARGVGEVGECCVNGGLIPLGSDSSGALDLLALGLGVDREDFGDSMVSSTYSFTPTTTLSLRSTARANS
jgi:hypothetical protein